MKTFFNIVGVVGFLFLTACSSDLDTKKLEGVWKLERIEGPGFAPQVMKFTNGQFELLIGNKFGCTSPFKVSGNKITVSENTSCNMASTDLEVESLEDTKLVIKKENVKFHYIKTTEANVIGPGTTPSSPGTNNPTLPQPPAPPSMPSLPPFRTQPNPGSPSFPAGDISGRRLSLKKSLTFSHHGATYIRYNQPLYSNQENPPVCYFKVPERSYSYMYLNERQEIQASRMEPSGNSMTIHFETVGGSSGSSNSFSITCVEQGRPADLQTFRTHLSDYINF